MIIVNNFRQTHANMLCGEGNDCGCSTERRRCGRALKRIGVHQARGCKLLDMRVAVDTAGHDQLAARIDFAATRIETEAQCGDRFTADSDVGRKAIGCRHHGSATNDEIERLHRITSVGLYNEYAIRYTPKSTAGSHRNGE